MHLAEHRPSVPSTGAHPPLDSSSVYKHAIRFAKARYASTNIRYRRARCLLQALGL